MSIAFYAVIAALIAGSVYAIWLDHEQQKSDRLKQRRKELDAAMQLTHDLNKRGPSGIVRNRRAS